MAWCQDHFEEHQPSIIDAEMNDVMEQLTKLLVEDVRYSSLVRNIAIAKRHKMQCG
jgi:hypothetical protein